MNNLLAKNNLLHSNSTNLFKADRIKSLNDVIFVLENNSENIYKSLIK